MMQTITGYQKITEARYRECCGPSYEELIIGYTIEHRPGRTITETDNIWQSLLNMNPHPVHIDNAYSAETQFGKPLVSSLVTLSMVTGMSVRSTSGQAIANLGWKEIKLLSPVFVGDTIYAESTVLDKRVSQSNSKNAIVTIKTIGKKSDDQVFMKFERSFLMQR